MINAALQDLLHFSFFTFGTSKIVLQTLLAIKIGGDERMKQTEKKRRKSSGKAVKSAS